LRLGEYGKGLQVLVSVILAAYGGQLAAASLMNRTKDLEYFKQLCYVGLLLPSIWLGNQQLYLTDLVSNRKLKELARFKREMTDN
jgi:hypothetical protein